jgi:predicted double-glycine peptidase
MREIHTYSLVMWLMCGLYFPAIGWAQPIGPIVSLKEIRQRGVVMQQWETSCAAAALATVLTYRFKDPVSESYVALKMLDTTQAEKVRGQGGFSMLDMKTFIEGRGYQASAYKNLDFADLRAFSAPIVPINQFGYNHYVVFNGVQGDMVQLADPAFGNRSISLAEFSQVWTDGLAFVVTQ